MKTKKTLAAILAGMFVFSMVLSVSAMAAKPQAVIEWSNGFPSGEHYNLNIHGKKPGFTTNETSGGSSIFVSEYGDSQIQIVQNKKSSVSEMMVLDSCSFGPDDPAIIQLPAGEYQVYARILAKPGNDKKGETRSVMFYPELIGAANDNATNPIDGFGNLTDPSSEMLVGLGVVTYGGAFTKDSQYLERIAPTGKGKNRAVDISTMFEWSGWIVNETADTNGDGMISVDDVPLSYDANGDGIIDEMELIAYLQDMGGQYVENEWIFNIADLVMYGWDYQNNGSKLVQIRFYPVDTTEFI